ncbi:MAG: YdiU family protein [Puniceicoccaceae bacterium]|nr:MAG: YdiU family protein [Puniceicoccaceae bacterium]
MGSTVSRLPMTGAGWRWEHTYAALPAVLYSEVEPEPGPRPELRWLNRQLAVELGLDPEVLAGAAAVFAGSAVPTGARPIAQAYSGHQYGHFTTLGDGRALLLGEHRGPDGSLRDVQWKGAGRTPYSRRGDGRAALGPMLRECVLGEAMHALGIPTTRGLAVATTGLPVWRETELTGAVLTRIAASHIRVGTFEQAVREADPGVLRSLLLHTLERHFPERRGEPEPAAALLDAVVEKQARLIAAWMRVGFVHGVMNTDNLALSGETIDYGPCAFLEVYHPEAVFSSIDHHGRYAYGRQPAIALWNLTRLAETLLRELAPGEAQAVERAKAILETFGPRFEAALLKGMRAKLGLLTAEGDDPALIEGLLNWMRERRADYTNTFAFLAAGRIPAAGGVPPEDDAFRAWEAAWKQRLARQPQSEAETAALRRANCPAVIPRNQRVEAALAAAAAGDLRPFETLIEVVRRPYDHEAATIEDQQPDPRGGADYRTFCGT